MNFLKKIDLRWFLAQHKEAKGSPGLSSLKICLLNTENLFISMDLYEGQDLSQMSESQWRQLALPQLRQKQKPLSKIWGLVSAIEDIQPDILMLVEVGGKESLHHFQNLFLKKNYKSFFVETNSQRSIDLAFLVRKDLTLKTKLFSNRETPVRLSARNGSSPVTRFSRDVAELHIFENHDLRLILLLTHLKSKISSETDFQGRELRQAEAEALAELYKKKQQQHPGVPVVVGGDFNADLESPELVALSHTDLTDFHDHLKTPKEQRISFVHFPSEFQPNPQVLDYLLVSPHLRSKIVASQSFTYRYKSFYDTPHPLPRTLQERYHMPSDHYPVVLTLDMNKE